jgi:hypothetical protein
MNNVAFLVLSCDKYADLWQPYAQLFDRYWPDCPFDKYFATNEKPFNEYGFQSILIGQDKTWSNGLYNAVIQLENKYHYVIITLEDLFLITKVSTIELVETLNSFFHHKGNYLRLYTKKKPTISFNTYFSILKKNVPYYQTCVYSLWKLDTLKQVIDINENAWEFEKRGAMRCYSYGGFYSSNKNHFEFSNTIIKGKWVKSELKKIKVVYPNLIINRKINNKKDELNLIFQKFLSSLFFKCIPYYLQNKLLIVIHRR